MPLGRFHRRHALYLTLCISILFVLFQQRDRLHDTSGFTGDAPLGGKELRDVLAILQQPGFTGENARPHLKDMILVADLAKEYLPGRRRSGNGEGRGRLVIVGDVHGQKSQFNDLLRHVDFEKGVDHLILVGDLIAKGPDSSGVIDLAIDLGASAVRGNHEDRIITLANELLLAHGDVDTPGLIEQQGLRAPDLPAPIVSSFSHGDDAERKLVHELGERRVNWLKSLPIILRLGRLGGRMGNVVVVHAGLAPGVKLRDQDPTMVMNMRSVDKHGLPTKERQGLQWTKVWNKYQHSFPARDRTTVIYGHDQKRGLQLHDYSFGLDTGCINGGMLTAMLIEGDAERPTHRIAQVGC